MAAPRKGIAHDGHAPRVERKGPVVKGDPPKRAPKLGGVVPKSVKMQVKSPTAYRVGGELEVLKTFAITGEKLDAGADSVPRSLTPREKRALGKRK